MLLLPNPKNALEAVYTELDYTNGSLCPAVASPGNCPDISQWIDKGEWLTAAKRAGAEKIFFVNNNPVVVFAQCGSDNSEKIKAFNQIWCLARPRLLFLASPGELTVLDLAQKPVDDKNPKNWDKLKKLRTLDDIGQVASELQSFHRDNIESGRVFGDERFGGLNNRADKALIRDLKTVRVELMNAGLSGEKVCFAHALIGRSIFIRYLEDRGIVDEKYFRNLAARQAGWTDILKTQPEGCFDFSEKKTFYPRVLRDKEFCYALFRKLAQDFNGDMFPDVDEEEKAVKQKHLDLVQTLLYGNAGRQKKLFFYSYRFDIVPLDLISSIYEEFYHSSTKEKDKKSKARQNGAYYTPPVLAEFVLSRVLTPEAIKKNPRVLDMACGSGIFLVEAFRRIARYRWHKKKAPLTFDELKNILKDQIAGIEAVEEAARIAAFSLYLSMLHYLDPPAIAQHIKQGNKLPNLLASNSKSPNHYHCILAANAFDVDYIESNPHWNFGKKCADIIVGNPPWGAPGNKADDETKERHKVMLEWCKANNNPIGDQEPCQAFLWRALDFLKKDGKAGMLTSAGVLFKHNTTTRAFRKEWLNRCSLKEVFNFASVRNYFFKSAISPFMVICFDKNTPIFSLMYSSIKETSCLCKTQGVMLSRHDCHWLRYEDLAHPAVWKIYWQGQTSDMNFIKRLQRYSVIADFVDDEKSGAGYKIGIEDYRFYTDIQCLGHNSFSRYQPVALEASPVNAERPRNYELYIYPRLIIKRGIQEQSDDKGTIIAQYTPHKFAFSEWFYGIQLQQPQEWMYKVLIGILWSSFARYYLFMTSSQWGLWYNNIHYNDELLQLPVVLDKDNASTKEVISIVDQLRSYHPQVKDVLHPNGTPESEILKKRRALESQLDEAVFKLYGLGDEQKDLIRDCCEITLPFFYQPFDSIGAMPAVDVNDSSWLENYIHIFCRRWNAYLDSNGEMRAEIHLGANDNMVAIDFYAADKNDSWNLTPQKESWGELLEKIGHSLPLPMGTSQILLDGLVHVVSDDGITIIKRNEKRFWTRSLAREDADSTLCKRMTDTMPKEGAIVNGPSHSS